MTIDTSIWVVAEVGRIAKPETCSIIRRNPAGTVHGLAWKGGECVPHSEPPWMLEKVGCFSASIAAAVDGRRDNDKSAAVINSETALVFISRFLHWE